MFGNKTPATQKTIGTLIGAGTTIEGTLTYTGGLRIDGSVRGDVRCGSVPRWCAVSPRCRSPCPHPSGHRHPSAPARRSAR